MLDEFELGEFPKRKRRLDVSLLTNHIWSGVAFMAALSLTASHANAQHGSFNLPVEARWGNVVLPPGSYRISTPMRVSPPRIIEVSGNGKTVPIMVGVEESQPPSDHSYLWLLNMDGTYVVREFHAGDSGKVFTFLLPKTMDNKLADLRKMQATRLPIGTSGQ